VQVARLGLARGTTPGFWFPLAVWALAFGAVLARAADGGRGLGGALRRLLASRPLGFLGEISYSTYLAHWPVLVASQAVARRVLDAPSPLEIFAWHVAISFPLIVAVSRLLFVGVERPGIELGRRIARRTAQRD
jgi:peptidoglycan/LPS O-acetylase OafA/YrhL